MDAIEIRRDDKGGIDEIVGEGVLVHVERMAKSSWFIILTRPDQTQEAFWLNGKGRVEFTMHEHRLAPTTGPNSEPWTVDRYAAGYRAALKDAAGVVRDRLSEHAASLDDDGPTPVPRHRVAVNDLAPIAAAIEALPVREG